jgi:hypothetical protein
LCHTGDRCYDFFIFRKKIGEKIGVFYTKQSYIMENLIMPLAFEKIRQFFSSKVAENFEHDIDPRV